MRPETVRGWKVEPQFSGSIFDLRPATTYEIELRVVDPDGDVDRTLTISGTTRGVPGDPAAPSQDGVILDGGGGLSCNVLEVYGAGFVPIERLTLQNANRALRFQTQASEANVVRWVRIRDTRLGIGAQADQKDCYIAGNILEGRRTRFATWW